MELNRYIITADCSLGRIYYNTANESMIILEENEIHLISDKNSIQYKTLKNNGFFETNESVIQKIMDSREKPDLRCLDITLSVTQDCNLSCIYCSQKFQRNKKRIDYNIMEKTIEYICETTNNYGYKSVLINLFGGEPLLCKNEILWFVNKLKEKCSVKTSYTIDTNGLLLDKKFIEKFENIRICITLSSKDDHDYKRPYIDKKGSYDRIVENLIECRSAFNHNRKLAIRYNVDQNNLDINSFLSTIKKLELPISYFDIAYTDNYGYKSYENKLTKEEFGKWYIQKCIPALLINGYNIRIPKSSFYPCKAYSKHSIKVFHDGSITLCNSIKYKERKCEISEFLKYNKSDIFPVINTNPIDKECQKCKYLLLCGGKLYCRKDNYCNFIDYSIEDFLKAYAEYYEKGYGKQFV